MRLLKLLACLCFLFLPITLPGCCGGCSGTCPVDGDGVTCAGGMGDCDTESTSVTCVCDQEYTRFGDDPNGCACEGRAVTSES